MKAFVVWSRFGVIAVLVALSPFKLPAYLVGPADGLDKMAMNADLVCKARVVAIAATTNSWFGEIQSFEVREASMEIISVLKGEPGTNLIRFLHYASRSGFGFYSPQHYELETGRSYLVFASRAERAGEFRQLRKSHTMKADEGVMRTLDARPLTGLSIKDAHWAELNLLLADAAPSNTLYAVQQLNALSRRCGREWGQSDDFARDLVLRTLSPVCTHTNDETAILALKCFQAGPGCEALIAPHAELLVRIADGAPTPARRVAAIAAFSGTKLTLVSNALSRWLGDGAESVRVQSIASLPDFPGAFAHEQLRKLATDDSAKVRAAIADAIGNGQFAELLPTLKVLLTDPVGRPDPVAPLTVEQIQAGGRSNIEGDVHTSAGYALMKFDVEQVRDILKANLSDVAFRPNYLCKLAEKDAAPWLDQLAEVMESRRERIAKEVEASGVEPKTNYFRARMALSGTYFKCWHVIHGHLVTLPNAAFADSKLDRHLDVLEQAGNTGSREPVMIYELYRMKGMNERAARYRRHAEKEFANYRLSEFFDKADAR
jgi:hypothetical protein